MKNTFISIITFIGVFLIFGLAGCQTPAPTPPSETPTPIPVFEYDEGSPITLLYPADWKFLLPQTNLLIFGEENTLFRSEPGATMTILRVPTGQVHGNLEGELNHYLDFGPRRDGYTEDEAIEATTIADKSAFSTRLNFAGEDEKIPFSARVVAVEADNGSVYLFTATAPAEMWPQNEAKFSLMLGSAQINE